MAAWDAYLPEVDRRLLDRRGPMLRRGAPKQIMALLLIDMQVAACGLDQPIEDQLEDYPNACGEHAWSAMRVQKRLLSRTRAAGMPVVYSKHVFRQSAGIPRPADDIYAEGSPMVEIHPEVAMQPGDILIEKQRPSCFAFTNLALILRARNINSLLLCGNSTSGCVRATAVDAVSQGIHVQVIEGATFDRLQLSHAASLLDLDFKIAAVISSDDAAEQIDRSASSGAAHS